MFQGREVLLDGRDAELRVELFHSRGQVNGLDARKIGQAALLTSCGETLGGGEVGAAGVVVAQFGGEEFGRTYPLSRLVSTHIGALLS